MRRLTACLLFAVTAMAAHAQTTHNPATGTTVLPVVNNQNGQISALLLIEPSSLPALPSQRVIRPAATPNRWLDFGNGLQLRAGLSFEANPGVGVLCSGSSVTSVGALAGQCMLTDFNGPSTFAPGSSTSSQALLQLRRSGSQLDAGLGTRRDTFGNSSASLGNQAIDQRLLNSLLGGETASIDQRNASLVGQVKIGSQGWVSIGGTVARARLIPAGQLPGGLPPEWNKGSLNLSAGSGNFGGEISGQVIEVPGQGDRYSSVGAGMTWRTPWRAKVTVGADNIVTRGKNPFTLPDASSGNKKDEGRVPYVRYQQDL
ncbi:hypothetical protein [Arenimonas sp.]|uniref:XOO1806 family protein n=1 Tax=Arenimonas sp. TaxID=1872635 RepID=UPI0039E49264